MRFVRGIRLTADFADDVRIKFLNFAVTSAVIAFAILTSAAVASAIAVVISIAGIMFRHSARCIMAFAFSKFPTAVSAIDYTNFGNGCSASGTCIGTGIRAGTGT